MIASIHKPVKTGTKEENTRTYLNAMKNPYVTIIGHCDDVKYPVDYLAIVRAAMEHQILLGSITVPFPRTATAAIPFQRSDDPESVPAFSLSILLSSDSHGTNDVRRFYLRAGAPEKNGFSKVTCTE